MQPSTQLCFPFALLNPGNAGKSPRFSCKMFAANGHIQAALDVCNNLEAREVLQRKQGADVAAGGKSHVELSVVFPSTQQTRGR